MQNFQADSGYVGKINNKKKKKKIQCLALPKDLQKLGEFSSTKVDCNI